MCWITSHISQDWQMTEVVPIFKKGDCNDCDIYRGIKLLNTSQKLYASIPARRLNAITIPVSYTHLDVYKRQILCVTNVLYFH